MSARPFMQLYVSDFLGDTLYLSAEEIGAYLLLLMAMWNAGGTLPSDEEKLARVARMSPKKWRGISGSLMPFFRQDGVMLTSKHFAKWSALAGRQPIPANVRSAVLEKAGFACTYCGTASDDLHIDHVFPVSLGGTNDPSNLTAACRACNLSKGAKTLEEWLA